MVEAVIDIIKETKPSKWHSAFFNFTISFIIIAIITTFLTVGFIHKEEQLAAERYTYTGTVIAVQKYPDRTFVWLSHESQAITIAGNIDLAYDKTYEITVEGHGSIISIRSCR